MRFNLTVFPGLTFWLVTVMCFVHWSLVVDAIEMKGLTLQRSSPVVPAPIRIMLSTLAIQRSLAQHLPKGTGLALQGQVFTVHNVVAGPRELTRQ